MLYSYDKDWSTFVDSLPAAMPLGRNPLGNFGKACGYIEMFYGPIRPEEELFLILYYKYLCTQNPENIRTLNPYKIFPQLKPWMKYLRKTYDFSWIRYYLLAWDFYENRPLTPATKRVITGIAVQIPTNGLYALNSYTNSLQLPEEVRLMVDIQLKFLSRKERLVYYTESPSMEADIYLNLCNARTL